MTAAFALCLTCVAALAISRPAAAQPDPASVEEVAPARLIYLPGRFQGQCPAEVAVRESVSRRLGGTPFREPAERLVVLALVGEGDAPERASMELFDAASVSLGARAIESSEGCAELVEAAALAISIALSPSLFVGPVAPPPVEVPPEEPTIAPVDDAVTEEARPPYLTWLPDGSVFLVGFGAHGSALLGPEASTGVHFSVSARVGQFSLGLEQRQNVPRFSDPLGVLHGASVNDVLSCAHQPLLSLRGDGDALGVFGCGALGVGSVWAVGDYVGGGPYLGAGGRAGAAWTQADLSAVRLWGQVEWSIVRPAFVAFNGPSPFEQDAVVNVAFGVTYEVSWPREPTFPTLRVR